MLILALFLAASFFLLFYVLTGNSIPEISGAKDFIKKFGPSIAGAVACFFLASMFFMTPVAGVFWGILGWFIPPKIRDFIVNRRKNKLSNMAKSFITTASGLYGSGHTTSEVVSICADRFPEPFASELQNMIGIRNLYSGATFPKLFRDMSKKYDLHEIRVVAEIMEASEESGGPDMAAQGLKRLNRALRQRDRLIKERQKNNFEALMAAILALGIIGIGLLLGGTVLRPTFSDPPGPLLLGVSSGIFAGMLIFTVKSTSSEDLA